MWVVKLGGSLSAPWTGSAGPDALHPLRGPTGPGAIARRGAEGHRQRPASVSEANADGTAPALPEWLKLLAQLGGGRVVIVPGGGAFADTVRQTQARWQCNDLAAHNMAVLAMAQTAFLHHALQPRLHIAASVEGLRRVLRTGHTALWLPLDALRETADAHTSWNTTSDSLALLLAERLGATRLDAGQILPDRSGAEPRPSGAAGIVDAAFAGLAAEAACTVQLLHKADLAGMRALLEGSERESGVPVPA